jgi:hypothetical protein
LVIDKLLLRVRVDKKKKECLYKKEKKEKKEQMALILINQFIWLLKSLGMQVV